jgi:hypothetical protein
VMARRDDAPFPRMESRACSQIMRNLPPVIATNRGSGPRARKRYVARVRNHNAHAPTSPDLVYKTHTPEALLATVWLLGKCLVTQADTRALTLQFAVRVVGWIEFQAAVLARDAWIIVGLGGLGDYPIGPDQSQKKDHRYDYVSHIAVL